ncbi:hypothetical protein MASR1M68_04420 [Elusimicrobiota bacterium]
MRNLLLVFTVIILFYCNAFAGGAGTTIFQVLNIPTTAYDASLSNINIIRQNSNLMPSDWYEFNFTQGFHLVDTKYSAACANLPLSKYSTFGISVVYFDYGNIPRTYSDGLGGYIENGQFGASDKVFSLSYGLRMSKKLSGSVAVKYVKQDIDDTSYSGFAVDANARYFIKKNVAIGSGISNLGSKVNGYSLPSDFYLGIFGNVTKRTKLIAQIDNYYNDDLYELKMAAETGSEKLRLRIGYDFPLKKQNFFNANDNIINNFSFGIGLNFDFLILDYAWLPEGQLGNVHMFTVGIKI